MGLYSVTRYQSFINFGSIILVVFLLLIFQPTKTVAAEFHPGLSLQGYTGILNTPNAHVTEAGSFYGLYSNQKESKWRDRTSFQDNYLFSVGLFSVAEIGGRLTEAPGVGARDLSGNAKLTTEPLTRNYPLIPVLAVGMQDMGGGAKFLQTKYIVTSQDFWRFRFSTGYGFGPDRMKGAFGGVEFKAHDWVYLLGEYDTKETNMGARVITPPFWKVPISFTATAKTSLDHKPGNFDIGVGLNFPLDFRFKKGNKENNLTSENDADASDATSLLGVPHSSEKEMPPDKQPATVTPEPQPPAAPMPLLASDDMTKLIALKERLVRAGFLNVRIGAQDGKVLVMEYENVIFNHNELDALGVVSGMATEALKNDYELLRVIIKKKGIRMQQVTLPLPALAAYLENGRGLAGLKEAIVVSNRCDDDTGVSFVGGGDNTSFLTASLMLWPGLSTWVGTEIGVFDYLLSLKPDLTVNLWKGSLINARWDVPFAWSDNLNEGKIFRDSRSNTRMERLMLFQGIKLLPDVMAQVGGGMYLHNLYGSLNELIWMPGEGRHRVRLVQFWGRDDKTRKETETYLASYRYYFNPLDLSLEGTVGKFWSQDRGYALELKRMFSDTAVSLYYKNSTDRDNKHWQAAGIQFSFPLTPRRDLKHYYRMQVRGADEWSYAQETTLTSSSQKFNDLPRYPLAINPQPPTALYRTYYNRDRMNAEYVRSHLDRLRDAWLRYGKPLGN